jgi:hypothetical protein
MRQNKKENKNKRKNEEWIQKARHASSVKDMLLKLCNFTEYLDWLMNRKCGISF